MKAVLKIGPGKDGICCKDVPEPSTGEKEVKIAVNTAGICGMDLHICKDVR